MILDGEKRGKTAKEIIGDDYKSFCDNVIEEIPKLSKLEYILSLSRTVLLSLNVLLLIWLVCSLIKLFKNNTFPYFTITLGDIITVIIIVISAFGIFNAISKNSFFLDDKKNRKSFSLFLLFYFFL